MRQESTVFNYIQLCKNVKKNQQTISIETHPFLNNGRSATIDLVYIKGTKGILKLVHVGKISGDSNCYGAKLVSPKLISDLLYANQI